MPTLSLAVGFAGVTFLAASAALTLPAQTFAANIGTAPARMIVVDQTSTPHYRKVDLDRLSGHIRDGMYTVDGMVAKVRLNYDLGNVQYLYLFAPGIGTAVVSPVKPPKEAGAIEATLDGTELKFTVGEHRFDVTGVQLANEKGVQPAHVYARLDRSSWELGRQPMVGFGNAVAAPYEWPGALSPAATPVEEVHVAPPVPVNLLPKMIPATAANRTSAVAVNPAALRSSAVNR